MNDPRELANIIAQIQQMQQQNGLRLKSPLGQGYYPMNPTPAPPGYRMNQDNGGWLNLAAMGDDPRKKGISPLNQTEGAGRLSGRGGKKTIGDDLKSMSVKRKGSEGRVSKYRDQEVSELDFINSMRASRGLPPLDKLPEE
jgi:hypothetical protein